MVAPAREPLDWGALLEEAETRVKEERGRATVAELRREELRRSEREARSLANSLTRQLDTCRFKLKAAAPKTASRAVKALERRVSYQDDEIDNLRLSLRRSHEHQEQLEARHQDEINWLKQDIDRGRSRIAKVYREGKRVAESLRKQFDRQLAAARRLVEARGRQSEVPDPALDRDPQPRLAHPRHRAPAPAGGLDRALRHHPRADRNLRQNAALHRRRLSGVGLDPRRDHPGPWALRQAHETTSAEKGHLAPPPAKRLETHSQSLESHPGAAACG